MSGTAAWWQLWGRNQPLPEPPPPPFQGITLLIPATKLELDREQLKIAVCKAIDDLKPQTIHLTHGDSLGIKLDFFFVQKITLS